MLAESSGCFWFGIPFSYAFSAFEINMHTMLTFTCNSCDWIYIYIYSETERQQQMNNEKIFYSLIHSTFDTACELTACSIAVSKMCCIVYTGLFVSVQNQLLVSPTTMLDRFLRGIFTPYCRF